jgi:hypothetical protein
MFMIYNGVGDRTEPHDILYKQIRATLKILMVFVGISSCFEGRLFVHLHHQKAAQNELCDSSTTHYISQRAV